jgi:hypothetical protein
MESSSFIGIVFSEPFGKTIEDCFVEYCKNYGMIRRKAAEPRYIITGIDYGITPERRPVVIGDWR